MVIIQKKRGGTWWKCLLSFFAGILFVPIAIAGTAAYVGTQMTAGQLLGQYADTVLTVEYQEKTVYEIVNDFLSQRVDYNTLGGLAQVSPLIDTYLGKVSDALNDATGLELDLDELKTKTWNEIPQYLIDSAKSGVKLSKILGVDESSDNIMKSLCFPKKDDGTFDFENPHSIADLINDPHFIQNKIDNLTIKDVIGDSGEGASKVIHAIENKTIKQLKTEDVFGELLVSDIIEVTESSSNVLKAIKDKTINELKNDDVFGNLLISDVIDINDSSTQILKTFRDKGTKVKEMSDAIDDLLLSEVIEINDSSAKILKTFKEKGTKVKDLSNAIDDLYLSDAYESDDPDSLPPVMKKLLGTSAEPVLATGSPLMAHIDYEVYNEVIFSNGIDKTAEDYQATSFVGIKNIWEAHDIEIVKSGDEFVVNTNGSEDRSALATREFDIETAIPSDWTSLYVAECNRTKFKIQSIVDGEDCQGVVGYIQPLKYDGQYAPTTNSANGVGTQPSQPTKMSGGLLYRTNRFPIIASGMTRYMRITIPMLLDGRFNPFADESDYNTLHEYFKRRANAVYLRVEVRLYDSRTGGNLLKYYQNWPYKTTDVATPRIIWESSYGWRDASTSQTVPSLIEWCKFDSNYLHHTECGTLGGLNKNHEAFYTRRKCTSLFTDMEGMHVPFPQVDGTVWCEIAVYDELYIYDEDDTFSSSLAIGGYGGSVYSQIKWWLVGFPTVEVVRWEHEQFQDYDVDDIEESGYINTLAKEELSIDTICGTIDEPAARGAYLVSNRNVEKMQRANRLTSVEQLLIGTIYSQYATRHLKLEGSVRTVAPYSGILLFTDANIESTKKFLITNETFNVIDCESEATLVEVSPDSYTSS